MITYTFKKGSEMAVNLRSVPYTWGGQLSTFSVHVEKSTGLVGKPSLKAVEDFDWKYLHGTTPDLSHRRYQDRDIALTCWMEGDSKQQLVERLDTFLHWFRYDDLILMKVAWDTDNDNGGVTPNPHASKGLFYLVWLKAVSDVRYKWRKGKNIVKFTLNFVDPYPVKRIYSYTGEEGDGVIYDIVSDSEIDIYTNRGDKVQDITDKIGVLRCQLNTYIIVCGDVEHAVPDRPMFVPTNPNVPIDWSDPSTYTEPVDPEQYTYPEDIITAASSRDTVTMIYAEI